MSASCKTYTIMQYKRYPTPFNWFSLQLSVSHRCGNNRHLSIDPQHPQTFTIIPPDDENESREARRTMLPDELDPSASNSNTEQSQVNGNESPITEVPDFTRDQAKSQVSKLKKTNGNDLAVIALILTVSTFFPLAFLACRHSAQFFTSRHL